MGPFGWVRDSAQPRALAALTLLAGALSLWLWSLGRDLVTPEAPQGIVSFELARHADEAGRIILSWSEHAQASAMLIQGLDYLYLLVYPAWLSLAAARLGARLGGVWHQAALVIAWIVLACAPLDALENHALIQQLLHGPSQGYAQLAWWCAVPKFALVAAAGVFLAAAGTAVLLASGRAGRPGDEHVR